VIIGNHPDLFLSGVIVAATAVLSLANASSPLLSVLAFISLFFLAGYAVQASIFPSNITMGTGSSHIKLLERLALSIVLSLLITGLTGTLVAGGLLGMVIFDITKPMVVAINVLVTFLAIEVAISRRQKLGSKVALRVKREPARQPLNKAERGVVFVVSALLIIASAVAVANLRDAGLHEPFTEFGISGSNRLISGLPSTISAGSSTTILVFSKCMTNHPSNYTLTVALGRNSSFSSTSAIDWNATNPLFNGSAVQSSFSLSDGMSWERAFSFSIYDLGKQKVYLLLDDGKETRMLWLWVLVQA
jgi:uncharacterized membrane protein